MAVRFSGLFGLHAHLSFFEWTVPCRPLRCRNGHPPQSIGYEDRQPARARRPSNIARIPWEDVPITSSSDELFGRTVCVPSTACGRVANSVHRWVGDRVVPEIAGSPTL